MQRGLIARAAAEIKSVTRGLTSRKDFREWEDKQFERVMFFEKDGAKYSGFCECGAKVELPFIKGGAKGKCPACGREVVYRQNRYAAKSAETVISVLERRGDGLIQRLFVVYKTTQDGASGVTVEYNEIEEGRYYFDLATGEKVLFHLTTSNEWKRGRVRMHGCGYRGWRADENGTETFAVGGFEKLLAGTAWQYSALDIACKKMKWQPLGFLTCYFKEPKIESLLKIGLYGLAEELARYYYDYDDGGNRKKIRELRSPKSIGIKTAEDYKTCECLTWSEIKAWATVKKWKIEKREEADARLFVKKFIWGHGEDFNYKHITTERLYKYWKEQVINFTAVNNSGMFIRDYSDYVKQCGELKLNIDDTAIKTPKDFNTMHERTSGEVKIKRDKETDEKIKAFYKDIHGLTEWTDGEYSVIMPKTAAAIIKEGKEMHHCVGGYCGRVAKRESVILFIRRNANKRAAFVTMEIHPYLDRIEIVQVRAKRNAEPSAEVIAFLEKYKKWFNTRALPEKAKSSA